MPDNIPVQTISMPLVCILVTVSGALNAADTWKKSDAITGVGEISKTRPTGQNSKILHYGGTGTPETADFEIDVSGAKDLDCNVQSKLKEDAGLEAADTNWSVPAKSGTIVDGGFTTTFTPGDTPMSQIWVKAKVFEGHNRSWANGDNDAPVERRWDDLTTFIVGVKLDPGNLKYYEDGTLGGSGSGAGADPAVLDLGTQNLNAFTDWTGILASPGDKQSKTTFPHKDLTWTALAETDTGSVSGTMGEINYKPQITVEGRYRFFGGLAGLQPPGSIGVAAWQFLGATNPYARAGVTLVATALGSKTQYKGGIGGQTVIQNQETKKLDVFKINEDAPTIDLAALSIAGSTVSASVNDKVEGSVDINGVAGVYDDSRSSEGRARLTNSFGLAGPPGKHAHATFGSSKPSYRKP